MSASLSRALTIQRRVVGALLLREVVTRYGRHNIGALWMVGEPMLFTLGIATLWYLARLHTMTAIPIVAFAITGYSSVLTWRNSANRCSKAIEPNLSLMYHRNVQVIDIFFSRIILETIGASASFLILTVLFSFIGVMKWPADPLLAAIGWLLLCWFALALGLIAGSLSELSETFGRVWHVITYLMFPISGAVFMVHWLPPAAQEAVLWLPMVHGVEMVRHGYFGNVVPTHESPAYLIISNLTLTLIGLALVRETAKRVELE